jgi:hypothetical protein
MRRAISHPEHYPRERPLDMKNASTDHRRGQCIGRKPTKKCQIHEDFHTSSQSYNAETVAAQDLGRFAGLFFRSPALPKTF